MRRTIILLGAAASAAAFSASPMSLRGSATARAVSRSGATAVKMDDTVSLIIATLPGLAALGLLLEERERHTDALRCALKALDYCIEDSAELLNERTVRFHELAGFKREMNTARTVPFGAVKVEEVRMKRSLS